MERPTVRAMMKTSLKLGECNFISIEMEVTDSVRDIDKSTAHAIDRVYDLVQAKVAEKAEKLLDSQ